MSQNMELDEVVAEARFLLDRLNDFEPYLEEGECFRQYAGHVSPSVERLRAYLAVAPAPSPQTATEGEPDGWQHRIYYEDTERWSDWRDGKWPRRKTLDNRFEERPLFAIPPPAKAGEGETLSRAIAAALHSLRFAKTEVPLLGPKAEAVAVNNVGYFIAKAIEALKAAQ